CVARRIGPIPDWNAMPPPELATDTPILNVFHPMIVDLGPALRMEAHQVRVTVARRAGRLQRLAATSHLAVSVGRGIVSASLLLEGVSSLLSRWFLKNPLFAQPGLDRPLGALAKSDFIFVGVFFDEGAGGFELFDRHFSGLEPVQATQRQAGQIIHRPIGVHDVDGGQAVPLADVKVRSVMAWGAFEHTGPQFRINLFSWNDRDQLLLSR